VEVLKNGGNAVDAAVATAFALSVVEPYSSGLGGGGFMLIYPGPGSAVEVLDYREVAPGNATRDMYVRDGKVVPGLSTAGPLAIGVPGTVAGLCAALERYGAMSLAEVMAPAITLAEDGFTIDRAFYERSLITLSLLNKDPCAREIFLDHGIPRLPGRTLRQPDLARTLRTIAKEGPRAFYEGRMAETIVNDLGAKGGIITLDDLAGYKPRWTKPVTGEYRGYRIVSMPPPSSGGAVIIETLNVLEHFDLAAMGHDSPETVHLMAEAMRLAFADRSVFMGDPAFVDVPLDTLLSKDYAGRLREAIDRGRARKSMDVTPGGGVISTPQSHTSFPDTDMFTVAGLNEGLHTTHLSVVDVKGGAVSLTQTINTSFGSGVVACGTGIVMNNEMDDFAAVPGQPNAYGLVQGEANAVAPGKVPLSSMSPTMVFKDGGLFMVIGSPGGPRIITTVLQAVIGVIDFDMNIREAVSAPRIHHQWLPDQIYAEHGRLSHSARLDLEKKGHAIKSYILPCNAQGIIVLPGGSLQGASDPRGVGETMGY
jgi:gamma-glutamyltranspeptidase/glutathione hydrolase